MPTTSLSRHISWQTKKGRTRNKPAFGGRYPPRTVPFFHRLTDEAVGNWSVARQRSILARTFDHGKIRAVCQNHVTEFFKSGAPPAGLRLQNVALAFDILQQQRHKADYDNGFVWLRINAAGQIDIASAAFTDWRAVRGTDAAQDYLLALFLPRTPRI